MKPEKVLRVRLTMTFEVVLDTTNINLIAAGDAVARATTNKPQTLETMAQAVREATPNHGQVLSWALNAKKWTTAVIKKPVAR